MNRYSTGHRSDCTTAGGVTQATAARSPAGCYNTLMRHLHARPPKPGSTNRHGSHAAQSRRHYAIGIFLAVFALVVAACGPAAEPSTSDPAAAQPQQVGTSGDAVVPKIECENNEVLLDNYYSESGAEIAGLDKCFITAIGGSPLYELVIVQGGEITGKSKDVERSLRHHLPHPDVAGQL